MSKCISDIFDVEPYNREIPTPYHPEPGDELQSDIDYASTNIRQLIEIGISSVKSASNLAEEQENPIAYEVVGTMIKSLTDMNLKLIQLHEKKQTLMTKSTDTTARNTSQAGNVTNNAIFVGTTKDLNELIMKRISQNV